MLYAYFIFRWFAHSITLATANPAPFPQVLSAKQQKGGTPALVFPPLALQIVVLTHERWSSDKQMSELTQQCCLS